jgi:hypothetical protein
MLDRAIAADSVATATGGWMEHVPYRALERDHGAGISWVLRQSPFRENHASARTCALCCPECL